MKSNNIQNMFFVMGILIVGFISIYLFRAPKPLPSSTSTQEFSAYRAFEHIKQIAQKPHSIGTEEHERVKNYIIAELEKLGIETSVKTTTAINIERQLEAGFIHNILGVIKGTESKKSVLIVGHYDSQPNTLGAADDGSAVSSMLEAARALKQIGPFKNDILFLFTDGEESGLFGAKNFVDENPLKDSVGIVLNIEARGSSGPSMTYEVSPQNGWIMREYAKAVQYPFAHSIAYEIYKLLPNDSDFTPFRKAGLSGFNIAFIDDFANYHSMTDCPENISLSSLQHHGSYIMGIANHFGNIDLSITKSEDVVYFNWIGSSLIIYPIELNIFFVIVISLLLISVITIGIRKKRISISKILLGAIILVLTLVITIFFSWLLLIAIKSVYPYYSNFYSSNFYNVKEYFFAFSFLAIAIFSALYFLLYKRINAENLLLGALFLNFIVMFTMMKFIPSGTYLSIVPLIFILSCLLFCFINNFSLENKRWAFLLIHFVALIPVMSLLVPLIGMIFVTFGLNTIYGGIALLVILLGYLIIPIKLFQEQRKWALPIIALCFFLGYLIIGQLTSSYTKSKPLQSNVSYLLNTDKNEAIWFSQHKYIDKWKSQFFAKLEYKQLTDLFSKSNGKYLQNKASIFELPQPELTVVSDSLKEGHRKIVVNISTKRSAQNCYVTIPKDAKLSSLSINGKIISNQEFFALANSDNYSFAYFGINEKPLELIMNCNTSDKIELTVIESKLGLPDFDGYKPMPDNIIPDKGFFSNVTLIKRTWKF